VVLTPTHIAIAMEYAAGGELFERICSAGRFSEDEVSFPWHLKILSHGGVLNDQFQSCIVV
jgi:hypothetical protein